MSKLSHRTKLNPEQRQWLGRVREIIVVAGVALAGVYLMTSVNEVTTMDHCNTCTDYITGQQGGNLRLRDGDVLCITATGNFSGNLQLRGRNDTIRIVNEGVMNPNNMNFNRGYYVVENYGVFDVNPINYNQADYVRIINHETGQFHVETLNLRNQGIFENAGTFTARNFNTSGGATFTNETTGSVGIRGLVVNGGSTINNRGEWDISPNGLTLNNSTWNNDGVLNVATNLTVNGQSELRNTGSIDIQRDFTINSGEVDNLSNIEVGDDFTLWSNGTMHHSGTMTVDDDFTLGGSLIGPTGSDYGSIAVSDRSSLYGNSEVENNIDICDAGQPIDGVDDRWGNVGPNVTHCVHTSGGAGGVLPVELTDFRAQAEGGQVSLSWETASELNNHYFTIERSAENRAFEAIAEVDGAGNSQQPLRYQYTDQNPGQGRQYYRLKQTDFDGGSSYSSVVEVTVATTQQLSGRIYPNPAAAQTTLELEIPHPQQAIIQVSSLSGQVVKRSQKSLEAGQQLIHIDLGDLEAGIYIVNVMGPHGRTLLPGMKLVKR